MVALQNCPDPSHDSWSLTFSLRQRVGGSDIFNTCENPYKFGKGIKGEIYAERRGGRGPISALSMDLQERLSWVQHGASLYFSLEQVKRLDSRIQKSPETQEWISFFFTLLLHSQKAETGPFRGPAGASY